MRKGERIGPGHCLCLPPWRLETGPCVSYGAGLQRCVLVERVPEVPVLDMHEHVNVLGALFGVGARRASVRVAALSEGGRRLKLVLLRNYTVICELVFHDVTLKDLLRGRALGADPEQLFCRQIQIGCLHEAGAVAAQLMGS